MKMRKILSLAVVMAMGVSLLSGCGGSGGGSGSTAKSSAGSKAASTTTSATTSATTSGTASTSGNYTDNGSHELTVWCWDPAFNIYAMKEAEKVYQKIDPQFKLNIQEVLSDDIETKITTAATSGDLSTLPDIFLMQDNSFQKYTVFNA